MFDKGIDKGANGSNNLSRIWAKHFLSSSTVRDPGKGITLLFIEALKFRKVLKHEGTAALFKGMYTYVLVF